jgi:hypothetical protein
VSGVSSLFTIEFYQEVKRYLKPNGLLAQWIQGYELSDELLVSVLAAIDQEFADYLIVRIGTRDWVILSNPDGPVGELHEIVLQWPDTREALELLGIHDIGQIDGIVIANRRMLHPYLVDKQPNRDSMPLLDTGAERTRFLRSSAEFLHELRWTPAPLIPVLGGIERRPYPHEGIGDLRSPHILQETEQGMLQLRRFTDGHAPQPTRLTSAPMKRYIDATAELDKGGSWDSWLTATYENYQKTISHFDLRKEPWWSDVLAVAARDDAPERIVKSIALMDAMVQRDGQRLHSTALELLPQEDHPLPVTFRAVAGLVGLELLGAPESERREYADAWLVIDDDERMGDVAFAVLRAFAMRPDDEN